MFDKEAFSKVLTKIYKSYNNQRDFANATGVNRSYLSQYMNKKIDNPPTPKILEKIAAASNSITTYLQLMNMCGYISKDQRFFDFYNNEFKKLHPKLINAGLSESEIEKIFNLLQEYEYSPEVHDKKLKKILELYPQISDILMDFFIYENKFLENYLDEDTSSQFIKNDAQFYMCPVYGRISAGQPNWVEECIEGRIPIDPDMMNISNIEECFFLRVNGESMNQLVKNGGFALIHKQDNVDNGEVAVVLVNGFEATLKKFSKQGDLIILEPMSDDSSFQVQVYDKTTPIKILGKYIGKFETNK